MSRLAIERVRVRAHECDVYGHLNNANYLRFMAMSDEAVPPEGRLARLEAEFVRPVVPGDGLTVTAVREAAADGYERRRYVVSSGGGEAALGAMDFLRDGGVDQGTDAAAPPPPPPGTFSVERPVEWRDVGIDGAVSAATLAALAEDAGIRVVAAHAWPMTRCSAEGFAIVLRSMEAVLGVPVGLDDVLRIDTFASDVRRSMITRHYLVTRGSDGAPVCRFRSRYVWVDLERNRPIRVPEQFLGDLAANLVR